MDGEAREIIAIASTRLTTLLVYTKLSRHAQFVESCGDESGSFLAHSVCDPETLERSAEIAPDGYMSGNGRPSSWKSRGRC